MRPGEELAIVAAVRTDGGRRVGLGGLLDAPEQDVVHGAAHLLLRLGVVPQHLVRAEPAPERGMVTVDLVGRVDWERCEPALEPAVVAELAQLGVVGPARREVWLGWLVRSGPASPAEIVVLELHGHDRHAVGECRVHFDQYPRPVHHLRREQQHQHLRAAHHPDEALAVDRVEAEIVMLFGLARRTARKSRKYHYFTNDDST